MRNRFDLANGQIRVDVQSRPASRTECQSPSAELCRRLAAVDPNMKVPKPV
ncbi:hypothetical protein POX_f07561 [Penicillium oxalicum]|uniref:hypothetical protein n=1 Tax=Penicillium oxalicum TaxID=69781 RepID=UPI0020B7118F|nr:hypothetical protein POX_f07561 [Penicillium oxalicum]KAI2787198.1 hypothetical protein POX_f07561 [Penicillium oxalicum]